MFRKRNNFIVFILFIYLVSFILYAVLIQVPFLPYFNDEIKVNHLFIYLICIISISKSFSLFSNSYITSIVNNIKFNIKGEFFLILLSVIFLFCYLLVSNIIFDAFKMEGSQLKELEFINNNKFPFFQQIALFIISLFSGTYLMFQMLFFLTFKIKSHFRLSKLFFFTSSLIGIFNEFLIGGRTQLIYWILSYIGFIFVFKKNYDNQTFGKIKKISLYVSIPVSAYFIYITISRFSGSYSGETNFDELFSLIEYGGMGYYHFSNFLDQFNHQTFTFGRLFPIFYDFFALNKFNLIDYRNSVNVDLSIFPTIFGDLYVDIGGYGLFGFIIFINLVLFFVRWIKLNPLNILFLVFFIFNIIVQGIFFFSIWNKTSRIGFYLSLLFVNLLILKKNDINNNSKL